MTENTQSLIFDFTYNPHLYLLFPLPSRLLPILGTVIVIMQLA